VMRHFDVDKSGQICCGEFSTAILQFYEKNVDKFRPTSTSAPTAVTAHVVPVSRVQQPPEHSQSHLPKATPQKRGWRKGRDATDGAEPVASTSTKEDTSESLPEGWVQIFDHTYKRCADPQSEPEYTSDCCGTANLVHCRYYYVQTASGHSQWVAPSATAELDLSPAAGRSSESAWPMPTVGNHALVAVQMRVAPRFEEL
jgi:hypothetical protein